MATTNAAKPKSLASLRAKLGAANAKLEASQCQILPPGDYPFVIKEAREEHDEKRGYDYWYLKLDCGGKLTSDRFPIVDNMLWKLNQVLVAVGLDVDDLNDVRELVERTGEFIAEKKSELTIYQYQPSRKVLLNGN
jgi:hypothetical protein